MFHFVVWWLRISSGQGDRDWNKGDLKDGRPNTANNDPTFFFFQCVSRCTYVSGLPFNSIESCLWLSPHGLQNTNNSLVTKSLHPSVTLSSCASVTKTFATWQLTRKKTAETGAGAPKICRVGWWLFPRLQWFGENVRLFIPSLRFILLLLSGNQLAHSNSTLQARISPRWLSQLRRLPPGVPRKVKLLVLSSNIIIFNAEILFVPALEMPTQFRLYSNSGRKWMT